jgi:hypothetical protein
MQKYFNIIRSKECHNDYLRFADEHLIKAYKVYSKFIFINKKKRLRLIKELAVDQLIDIEHNLCTSNWVCLSKSVKKVTAVSDFIKGARLTIKHVTSIEKTK